MELNQEALEFVEACHGENEIMAAVSEKESVPDEAAFQAEVIVKNMWVDAIGDCLLYAASLNLLNTYVKLCQENEKTVGYWFKENTGVLLEYAADHPEDPMIRAEVEKDDDLNVCIIEINTIQTSFHSVVLNEKTLSLVSENPDEPELQWDGISKQRCAMTLFSFAMDNAYGRTWKMQDGTDFSEGMDQAVALYRTGELTLTDAKHMLYGEPPEREKKAVCEYRKMLERLDSGVRQSELMHSGWDFVDGLTKSHYEIVDQILQKLQQGEKLFIWMDERRFPGDTTYRNYLEEQLSKNGFAYTLVCSEQTEGAEPGNPEPGLRIYDGMFPGEAERVSDRSTILFFDSLGMDENEDTQLSGLKDACVKGDIPFYTYRPLAAMGYRDLGGGHNFLIRTLETGNVEYQAWFPLLYRIDVVHHPDQLNGEGELTPLIIPERFRYLYLEGRMAKENADWRELYRIFSCGRKGLQIYCEDRALGMYLGDTIEAWEACFDGIKKDAGSTETGSDSRLL